MKALGLLVNVILVVCMYVNFVRRRSHVEVATVSEHSTERPSHPLCYVNVKPNSNTQLIIFHRKVSNNSNA